MKFFLKHLTRSIAKRPLQPIIIILTLALAMATAMFAFAVKDTMWDEFTLAQLDKYGDAKLMISLGNTSESRFLFADDVLDLLGDDAKAVGCYELPFIMKDTGESAVAMATEFDRFEDIFDLEFLEYGKVTAGSISDVAFVSAAFASKNGLQIGDTLSVEAMGYAQTYRIEGIATRAFLGSYDVMVDISSIVRSFANNSLLFAAIGDDFKPCSKIYINFETGRHDTAEFLQSQPRFEGQMFEDLFDLERREGNFSVLEIVINFAVALIALLSSVVVFCCFYILANERTEENQAFAYAGAKPRMLALMQYTEVLIYWVIGTPLGILLSVPLVRLIPSFVSLQYADIVIEPRSVCYSALMLLGVCLVTTSVFIAVGQRMRRVGTMHTSVPPKWILYLILAIAVLFVLMIVLPASLRLDAYVITMAAIITLIFWVVPPLVRLLSAFLLRLVKGRREQAAIALRYALKNLCSLKLLQNIIRLVALIVTIVFTAVILFLSVEGQIIEFSNVYQADYVVFNATASCYEKTNTCESVERVYYAYLNQSSWGTVFSADDPSVYSDWMEIDRVLEGNEAIVTKGLAHAHDIRLGDTVGVELDGREHDFVIVEIKDVAANYLAINCDGAGIPYNMLLVRGKDGVSSSELLGDLSKTTASELAPIGKPNALLERFISSVVVYMDAGKILLFVLVLFSVIGMLDISYESLRARREEFALYRLAGMRGRGVRLLQTLELLTAVVFGCTIGLFGFTLSALALNVGMNARGIEIMFGIQAYFGW